MRRFRAAYGTVLLVAPSAALWCVNSPTRRPLALLTVRLLGARHVVQAAVGSGESGAGAAIDLVHAASMVLLAACAPHARRPAVASAAVSSVLAADALRRRRARGARRVAHH